MIPGPLGVFFAWIGIFVLLGWIFAAPEFFWGLFKVLCHLAVFFAILLGMFLLYAYFLNVIYAAVLTVIFGLVAIMQAIGGPDEDEG